MPLKVSENRRFLIQEDNSPFFYLGDTGWELSYRLNREEIAFYLQDRADKGFTVIHMMGVSEFGELERPNAEGHLPFTDKDPTRPNDAFFDTVEYIMDEAGARGLHIGFLPVWGDHVGPTLWGSNPPVLNASNAGAYGVYLGERFRDKPVIWILGGDRPVETEDQYTTWRALAAGLTDGDGGRHLKSFHPMGGRPSSEFWQADDWLDFNMIQTSHGRRDAPTYEAVQADYEKRPIKPTMEAEVSYENHPVNWDPALGVFDDYDVRKGAYWSLFAGGFGFTYGCNEIFSFWSPDRPYEGYGKFTPRMDWRAALQLPGAGQMRHVRTLLESRPFLTRIPDQSLLVSEPGTDHVQATRGSDGAYAFVYTASGRPVTVDLTRLSGDRLQAYWYDPRQGQSTAIGEFRKEGTRQFTPPSSGAGADWVLVLDDAAQGFAPPGGQGGRDTDRV